MFIHILTRILCKNNPNRGIVVKKKPSLTNKHRIKRIHLPKEHLLWYNEKWTKTIYNDEKKRELNSNARGGIPTSQIVQEINQNIQQRQ